MVRFPLVFAVICICVCNGYHFAASHLTSKLDSMSFRPVGRSSSSTAKTVQSASPLSMRASAMSNTAIYEKSKISNLGWRWITGMSLGALCTAWLFSSNAVFTVVFFIPLLLAQQEYYEMVTAINVEPTRRTNMILSILSYAVAFLCPAYHELVMPVGALYSMIILIASKKTSPSINEITTSLWGLLYLGYLPSFWIRLKTAATMSTTGTTKIASGALSSVSWLRTQNWALGSVATWFTWTSIVAADVGAYFFGKSFGRTKLGSVSPAAGAASPNKSVEGFFGGMLCCIMTAVCGAKVMNWPSPILTGAAYGTLLSSVSLVGDLTASMMKRDAQVKDSGTLLPGHGGLLDRLDSYVFTAPLAYIFVSLVVPLIKSKVGA